MAFTFISGYFSEKNFMAFVCDGMGGHEGGKIASQIEFHALKRYAPSFDNYYVDKIKPFFVNHEIYYEVVLEPADEKPNKFNRITAFTKCEITTNYCGRWRALMV